MSFKDSVRNKTGEILTDSLEMFEKIFAQATNELKIRRKPKVSAQDSLLIPVPKNPKAGKAKPAPAKQPGRMASSSEPAKKRETTPPSKTRPAATPRKAKGSRPLRLLLLFFLLVILAGFAANHFVIIDLSAVPSLLGLESKPVVQAPMPRKQPAKPAEKPAPAPKPPERVEKASPPLPAPATTTPSPATSEDKLAALETPTTMAPALPADQEAEEKAPRVAAEAQPKPPQVADTRQTQPSPTQTTATTKPAMQEIAPSKPVAPQYPYSVYLGSFKAPEAVKKALSDYHEKGLSAYWARVDLGDKGIWYRFFAGYFRTKEEAEKYISERKLQGATPQLTIYANWIGSYVSEKDAEDRKKALVSAGFWPYVIKNAEGKSVLYSGAFDRKEYAEKEQTALASKGIQSEVVER